MDLHSSFNNLDYVILVIILVSGLLALTRGFVSEVFSLIAWVGAYFIAVKFYPLAEPWVHNYIHNPGAAAAISAFALFFVGLVLLSVIGNSFSDLIKDSPLTSVDRSLGFVFGILRGLLVVCLVYLCLVTVLWPEIEKMDEHKTAPKLTEKPTDKSADKSNDKPAEVASTVPDWLINAHFRPALAYGSNILKSFIPENLVEKTKQEYYKGKDKIEVIIDEHKPAHPMTTPPAEKPAVEKYEAVPTSTSPVDRSR
jgi:membrane protein required for colicin V production